MIQGVKESRELLQRKLEAFENTKKVMEQWSEMGLRVFRMGLGSANDN